MSAPHGMGPPKRSNKTKTQSAKEAARILASADVVEILPDGRVRVLETDPAIDKGFNAGVEAAARWHKRMAKKEQNKPSIRGSADRAIFHGRSAEVIRELKRP